MQLSIISDPARRWQIIALIVACAFFMENLDGTIIVTALPQIARTFGVGPVQLSIGITAYLLTLAVFIPTSGWTADRFGTRNVFCAAIVVFTFASIWCGMANDTISFVAARVVQGGAAAMMSPVGRLLVMRSTEKRDLMRAISTITWPGLIAPVLGPPLGGFITTYANWRWVFFINVPIGVLGVFLVLSFVPNTREAMKRSFDVAGFFYAGTCLAAVIYGLQLLGEPTSRVPGMTLLLLGLAVGSLGVRHARSHQSPLINLAVTGIHTFSVSSLWAGSMFRLAGGAMPFLLPLLFQIGFGMTAFGSGMLVLAYTAGNLIMKLATTAILRRYGFRHVILVNNVAVSLTIAAVALIGPTTPVLVTVLLLLAAGLSRSLQFTALNTLAFADIPPPQKADASTLAGVTMQISTSIGVAVAAALISFSEAIRGSTTVSMFDLRGAIVAIAIIGLGGFTWFASLAPDAGGEVSGHKR